ncbi:molybdopterin-synthase adenylyltransferase MoeB [Bacillus subtilis]|uniref:molybdopterin-synthase adenylyltransferase MoeB n=1 Tax=Bacillus subtilis TaxID=1423 RepID=UPI000E2F8C21|nr:molybdopterin-synthase adenylyltransferase MoeB [Bacillus subtilis]MCR1990597.1 molybdopterin-synthase adenylyltransferase MoeB [Bacillus subtilis]MEC2332815.1 molybdopterin-synthase adenylyltransferase MoeB [Bacillus subtilis]MED1937351.1 molybdopterin-synthase adenylyltransferase MoeB [Bacillus subtilis]CAF1805946.1 Molybdopterin-synthase adenylyltransferase [Bacillus subtilis]
MEERYSRQIRFKQIGEEGQKRLADSHVLIVGAGALGTAGAEGLSRAGVGTITIIDRDYVEWSNLQRQQLYTESDAKLRMPKAMAAKEHLSAINSEIHIEAYVTEGTAETLEPLIEKADVVIDATDNFETRMLINDLAQKTKTPWVYGACVSSQGMFMTVIPGETPCLSCLFEQIPVGGATCDTAGIIPPAVHIVSAYQQAEALKLLTGQKEAIQRGFVTFDVWNNSHMKINVNHVRREECPSCGANAVYPYLQDWNTPKAAVLCGRDTVQVRSESLKRIPKQELIKRLKTIGKVEANAFLLHIFYENFRIVIFNDGRALVHGTNDVKEANSVLARVIGL